MARHVVPTTVIATEKCREALEPGFPRLKLMPAERIGSVT